MAPNGRLAAAPAAFAGSHTLRSLSFDRWFNSNS